MEIFLPLRRTIYSLVFAGLAMLVSGYVGIIAETFFVLAFVIIVMASGLFQMLLEHQVRNLVSTKSRRRVTLWLWQGLTMGYFVWSMLERLQLPFGSESYQMTLVHCVISAALFVAGTCARQAMRETRSI